MRNRVKWLAWITSVGMFFVLLGGALVTKTDSGRGCGDNWPLCHGKFIPAYTLESFLEYSHRLFSGITGLLVLATVLVVWFKFRHRKDAVLYGAVALFFTIVQAIMGALVVLIEQSKAIMALHFGFSLIAFAATILLALVLHRIDRPAHASGWGEQKVLSGPKVGSGFRKLVWGTTIYSYAVVYLGAYVRHTQSSAGCQGWPLCNGQVFPALEGETGVAFIHRVAALLLVILIVWLFIKARSEYRHIPEVRTAGLLCVSLAVLQSLSGALVVWTMTMVNVYIFSSLLHTVIVAVLFTVLAYMCVLVWRMKKLEEQGAEKG